MAKKVLIILAEGFEEVEAVTPVDLLRRADLDVTVAGLTSVKVKGAHNITIEADVLLNDYQGLPDLVVLPGGLGGAKNLGASSKVKELVCKMNEQKKWVSAICASPALVLAPAGVLDKRKATCYPGFEKNFSQDVKFSQDRVVVDGNIITSRSPGSAIEFSLKLVEQLCGVQKANELKEGLLAKV